MSKDPQRLPKTTILHPPVQEAVIMYEVALALPNATTIAHPEVAARRSSNLSSSAASGEPDAVVEAASSEPKMGRGLKGGGAVVGPEIGTRPRSRGRRTAAALVRGEPSHQAAPVDEAASVRPRVRLGLRRRREDPGR
ncbi:hypothetical protein DL767_008930 [Monosporascus sp. MG133]|nr:hypothetical protein DL767_008930 [Monosporascus sp. MG133]